MDEHIFCPNRSCILHYPPIPEGLDWYYLWGTYSTRTYGRVRRYKCRFCGKTFSDQSYELNYYAKKDVDYRILEEQLVSCASNTAMKRKAGVTTETIQNRLGRLGRQAIGVHSLLRQALKGQEAYVADGIETFCFSQYHPAHVNILVGKESQYLYTHTYDNLRRKGRMREAQKQKKARLEGLWKPDRQGILKTFSLFGRRIAELARQTGQERVLLITDEHPLYPLGLAGSAELAELVRENRFTHLRVSSRLPRAVDNPMFSVNYMDREMRKDLANYVRETTRWGKDPKDMMLRLHIYGVWHNYKKPYRVRPDKFIAASHGEVAGIDPKLIKQLLAGYYSKRIFYTHLTLNSEETCSWFRMWETPMRRGGNVYIPRYIAE
jgi:hypothetical protein